MMPKKIHGSECELHVRMAGNIDVLSIRCRHCHSEQDNSDHVVSMQVATEDNERTVVELDATERVYFLWSNEWRWR
jgi:hypothetical protein